MSDKEKYIEQLIYKELQPDRYCYIHNYIVDLKKQLQQKENIIKEVREFIIANMGYYSERLEYKEYTERYVKDINKIMNLLNKGE